MHTVADDVYAIIARHAKLEAAQITPATPLDALSIDSLAMVEIIFQIEEHFNITIPDDKRIAERFANFRTPADVVAAVEVLLAQKTA